MKILTQEYLKEVLHYDPETGIFRWGKRISRRIKKGAIAGTIANTGYILIHHKKSAQSAHRLAWLYVYGGFPDGLIDHINQIRTDNRICNLRCVNSLDNARNKSFIPNKSGVYGVYATRSKKWQAEIKVLGKKIHLGTFEIFEDAVSARKTAERKYGFHPNHGKNFGSKRPTTPNNNSQQLTTGDK